MNTFITKLITEVNIHNAKVGIAFSKNYNTKV